MRVFRIVRERHLAEALGGNGAALSEGNRWNSFGTRLVYTSDSRALALLELAVHLDLSEDLPNDRYMVEIEIPNGFKVLVLDAKDLPEGWNQSPPGGLTRKKGDGFIIEAAAVVMRVPSSIVPKESNYLINPGHPAAAGVTIISNERLDIDQRLEYRKA